MKYDKIKKLEYEVTDKSYEKSNSGKAMGWDIISMFFQVLNIFISFFFIYTFLTGIVDEFPYRHIAFGSIAVILLGLWEYLKRNTLRGLALKYLKKTNKLKNYVSEIVLTVVLIVGSGFMAIHGAEGIVDKTKDVKEVVVTKIDDDIEIITIEYNTKINKLEGQIDFFFETAKKRERTIYRSERSDIKILEEKITTLKAERDTKVKELEESTKSIIKENLGDNDGDITMFIFMTIFIELLILVGILYVANFDFKAYNEAIKSDEYRMYEEYDELLDIIYQDGKHKKDDRVYSVNNFHEMATYKIKGIKKSTINQFMSFLKNTETIKRQGKYNRFLIEFEDAKVILKNYFKY